MTDKQLTVRAVLRLLTIVAVAYEVVTPESAKVLEDPDVIALVTLVMAEAWFYGQKLVERWRA